jgi:hypothetical protein
VNGIGASPDYSRGVTAWVRRRLPAAAIIAAARSVPKNREQFRLRV